MFLDWRQKPVHETRKNVHSLKAEMTPLDVSAIASKVFSAYFVPISDVHIGCEGKCTYWLHKCTY
jgi:hypothetical protein